MALSKTWYTSANRAADDVSTATRKAASELFALKALLMGQVSGTDGPEGARPSSVYWTLAGSSDSSTAGIDSTDRIGSTFNAAKWVRVAAGGTPHTWFVLQSPSGLLDGPWYLCVDWIGASDQVATFVISKNVFSGGSTSARPTSVNESALTAQTFTETTAAASKAYFVTDANGGFYYLTSRNGQGIFQFILAVLPMTETRSGDGARTVMVAQQTTSARGVLQDVASGHASFRGILADSSAASTTLGMLLPTFTTTTNTTQTFTLAATGTNAIDAQVDALPIAYIFDSTTSHLGVRGRWPDMWATGGQVAVGSVVPATGNPERIVTASWMIPGSVAPSL
jgi:hypothetical protein